MKVTPDRLAVAEALQNVRCAEHLSEDPCDGLEGCERCLSMVNDAIIATVPTPTPDIDTETERFARIGKLFCELWEAGAPWPVRHWTCDKHRVKGCLRCKATTAPEVEP